MTALDTNDSEKENSAATAQSSTPVLLFRNTATLLERMLDSVTRGTSDSSDNTPIGGEGIHTSTDAVLDLLISSRRREVIMQLDDLASGELYTVSDLTSLVGAVEEDCDPNDVPEEKYDNIRTALIHHHLLMLETEGVIQFDRSNEIVRPGESVNALADLVVTIDSRCAE